MFKNRKEKELTLFNQAFLVKLLTLIIHFSLSDEKLDLNDSKWEDIHVITGALKMFFRELPEPLFTYNHFNDFVNAISKYGKQFCAFDTSSAQQEKFGYCGMSWLWMSARLT